MNQTTDAGPAHAAPPPDAVFGERQHLPAVFVSENGEQVTAPVYRLLADGFYGDTLWMADEVIVTELTPNHHMEPLNASAGQRFDKWLSSLPLASTNLNAVDLQEAAIMVMNGLNRDGKTASHDDFFKAVVRLGTELKHRRETSAKGLPSAGVQGVMRRNVAPMPNANFTDVHAGMQAQSSPVQRAAVERSQQTARRPNRPALSGAAAPDPQPGR